MTHSLPNLSFCQVSPPVCYLAQPMQDFRILRQGGNSRQQVGGMGVMWYILLSRTHGNQRHQRVCAFTCGDPFQHSILQTVQLFLQMSKFLPLSLDSEPLTLLSLPIGEWAGIYSHLSKKKYYLKNHSPNWNTMVSWFFFFSSLKAQASFLLPLPDPSILITHKL